MAARRHHYVPKCYLESFAVEKEGKKNSELNVFDKIDRKHFVTAPINVGLERDFNTIDLEGHKPDAFENAMATVESEIGPAIVRICESQSLSDKNDRALLLNLICLLHIRNPRLREIKRSFHERVGEAILNVALSDEQIWNSQVRRARSAGFIPEHANANYETMKQNHNENDYRLEVSNDEHIRTEMDTFNHALPFLFERSWVLIRASPDSGGFVTCDHPVSLSWSEPRRGQGPGLKHRGSEMLFHISPKLAVVGAYELEESDILDISTEITASSNGTIILNARRQVYAANIDFAYQIDQSRPPRPAGDLLSDERFKSRSPI